MSQRADILLEEFGNQLNMKGIKFDDNRLCSFLIENKHQITIHNNNDESVFVYGIVGIIGVGAKSDIFPLLLAANLSFSEAGLHTVAYEPTRSLLLLTKHYSLDGMTAIELERIIDTLAEQIEALDNNLQNEHAIVLYPPTELRQP